MTQFYLTSVLRTHSRSGSGFCFSCRKMERMRDTSFVFLVPLGLKSHMRQTFSQSRPVLELLSRSATYSSSSALQNKHEIVTLGVKRSPFLRSKVKGWQKGLIEGEGDRKDRERGEAGKIDRGGEEKGLREGGDRKD